MDIASDLAAVHYAATLTRDPTLDPTPNPEALATYRATGQRLAATLLSPTRKSIIRCSCSTRTTRPDRHARALAVIHDRTLLVVRHDRGPLDGGIRLVTHSLVDFSLARRDGFKSAKVYCFGCGALHDLGFGWLHRARTNEISTPSEHYTVADWGDPITPQGYTPRHPNDADRLAFAQTIGVLDGSPLLITLGFLYAFDYRDHFGFEPPHEAHLLRLIGDDDPRTAQDWLKEMLTPQWRKLELDPEARAEFRVERALTQDERDELVQYLTDDTQDTDDREDLVRLLPFLLWEDDCAAVQQTVSERMK